MAVQSKASSLATDHLLGSDSKMPPKNRCTKAPAAAEENKSKRQRIEKGDDDDSSATDHSAESAALPESDVEDVNDNDNDDTKERLFAGINDTKFRDAVLKARAQGKDDKAEDKCCVCGEGEISSGCDCACGVQLCQDCMMQEGSDVANYWEVTEETYCAACSTTCGECDGVILLNDEDEHECED